MPGNRQHVPRPGQNVRAVLRIVSNIYILFTSDFPLRIARDRITDYYALVVRRRIASMSEPTSALDAGTEADLVDVMERWTAGRTTIMIAHRLQTLRHCDLQLMLRQGRIVVQVHDWAVEAPSDEFVLC